MNNVHENHSGDLILVCRCEVSDNSTAEGMSNDDEGAMLAELRKCVVKFQVQLSERARFGSWIAPSITCAIVRADPREPLDSFLDEDPVEREIA